MRKGIIISIVIAAATAAVAVFTITATSDRPITALLASVTEQAKPAVRYAQNRVPDYIGFASAYGGIVGAADYVIAASIATSKELGNAICIQLRNGLAESELARRLTASSTPTYPITGSGGTRIVDSAHILICSGTH